MRDSIFEIEGKKIFTFGGATSINRAFRKEGKLWWKEELLSFEELDEGFKNLEKYNYVVSKPHPWIYTELAYLGLKMANNEGVIGIEDSSAGVLSLRFSSFPVIGLNDGNITKSGLDCLCHRKVDKLTEILSIL